MTDSLGKTRESILVVDDAVDILMVVEAFLVNAGFTVQKAASGEEALRKIEADPRIQTLVTDFTMPGMSGADLITHAKQVRPHLKALVITGYANAELPSRTPILVKPFRGATLLAEIRSLLNQTPVTNEADGIASPA
jgi:DNA-binding NtrC family response regulator